MWIVVGILAAVHLYLVSTGVPDSPARRTLQVILVICICLWVLEVTGVFVFHNRWGR
jgi:hypothetical protein